MPRRLDREAGSLFNGHALATEYRAVAPHGEENASQFACQCDCCDLFPSPQRDAPRPLLNSFDTLLFRAH
jgi:hypothetical protein